MKKIDNINKSILDNKLYIIFFLFFLFLCSLFPYSGDDWSWGSKIGLERLMNFFENYNGRYLGNLIVLILTRFVVVRNIVMACIFFFIIYFCKIIVNNKKNNDSIFLLSLLLLLVMPKGVFTQSLVWTSGFVNYAISIFLVLIFIYLIRDLFSKKLVDNRIKTIFLFLLGFSTSLFMENITIYIILLSIFVIIYSYFKNKEVPKFVISYFIGAILGAVLMFTNGAYANITSNVDTYRDIPSNGLIGMVENAISNYFNVIYKFLFIDNVILNLYIGVLLLLLAYKFILNNIGIKKKVVLLSSFVIILFNFYVVFSKINYVWKILLDYTSFFEGLFSIVYFIAIFAIILICINKNNVKFKLFLYLFSIIFITLPLFVVNPIGGRCFISTYVFFMLFTLELYNYLAIKYNVYIKYFLLIMISVLCIYLTSIYIYIAKINYERINYIKNEIASGKTEVYLTELPYKSYVWMSTPDDSSWETKFKLFYGIDEDIEFIIISKKEWHKIN